MVVSISLCRGKIHPTPGFPLSLCPGFLSAAQCFYCQVQQYCSDLYSRGCLYRDVDSTTKSSNTPGKHLGKLVGMSCVSGMERCHLQTYYTLYSNLLNVFKRVSETLQNHNVEAFMQMFTYSK